MRRTLRAILFGVAVVLAGCGATETEFYSEESQVIIQEDETVSVAEEHAGEVAPALDTEENDGEVAVEPVTEENVGEAVVEPVTEEKTAESVAADTSNLQENLETSNPAPVPPASVEVPTVPSGAVQLDKIPGETEQSKPDLAATAVKVEPSALQAYQNAAYTEVNNNIPFFSDDELSGSSFEFYSELDSLGRCGVAYASIGQDIMPTEERGEVGQIKPSGWVQKKYEGIVDSSPPYLYNRCHLIAFCLAGENANEKNLITGTRYLNINGMLPFENRVADYVKDTGNHVLYRVTPIFEGENLVASGVLMEAKSVEDRGQGICFNVYCYNVQPGITIDYSDGSSFLDSSVPIPPSEPEIIPPVVQPVEPAVAQPQPEEPAVTPAPEPEVQGGAFVVNRKNGKIHKNGACPATGTGQNAMKEPEYFATYEEAEEFSNSIAPSQKKRKCGNCWR